MVDDKQKRQKQHYADTHMPAESFLTFNKCNLPAEMLGCAAFQCHPQAIVLDGVAESFADIWPILDATDDEVARAKTFIDYFTVRFRLHALDDVGYARDNEGARPRLDARRLLLGWHFSTDSQEAAVLKGWAESRFGLPPRFHMQPIRRFDSAEYHAFHAARGQGVYNTNAVELQLDLLYAYTQYELARRYARRARITLFRGVSNLDHYEVLERDGDDYTVLLNNLNSFTDDPERADEFGALVMAVEIPLSKIFFFSGLLPGLLSGEREFIAIGGVYRLTVTTDITRFLRTDF